METTWTFANILAVSDLWGVNFPEGLNSFLVILLFLWTVVVVVEVQTYIKMSGKQTHMFTHTDAFHQSGEEKWMQMTGNLLHKHTFFLNCLQSFNSTKTAWTSVHVKARGEPTAHRRTHTQWLHLCAHPATQSLLLTDKSVEGLCCPLLVVRKQECDAVESGGLRGSGVCLPVQTKYTPPPPPNRTRLQCSSPTVRSRGWWTEKSLCLWVCVCLCESEDVQVLVGNNLPRGGKSEWRRRRASEKEGDLKGTVLARLPEQRSSIRGDVCVVMLFFVCVWVCFLLLWLHSTS